MLSQSELTQLLQSSESHWVERKPPDANSSEIRQTLVAFANSVSDGQSAVLFIGVSNDGKPQGVDNADKTQKTVTKIAEHECYPPVKCSPTAIRVDGVELVAVVVEASSNRPHFSGHAYVRVGSESKKASAEKFEELIASRNDKVRQLLREKDKTVTISWRGQEALRLLAVDMETSTHRLDGECVITACDNFLLHFNLTAVKLVNMAQYNPEGFSPTPCSVPVASVEIGYDNRRKRMKLCIGSKQSV